MKIFSAHSRQPAEVPPRRPAPGVATERVPGGDAARADRIELSGDAPPQDPAERLAAFADAVHERLELQLRDASPEEARAIADALAEFDQNMARIQGALAEGALDRRDLARALQGTMEHLRGALAPEGPPTDPQVEGTRGGTPDGLERRLDALEEQVSARVAELAQSGLSAEQLAALREAHSAFAAGLERLQGAELGARGVHEGLEALFAALREDLGDLAADDAGAPSLYDRSLGTEDLTGGPSGIDHTV
jgi:hypothetical protein